MGATDFRPDLNVKLICPECRIDPPDIEERYAEGDMVCGNCGLVLSDRIVDSRSEWRTFANDDQGNDDPSRVGDAANPLLDGNQLNTIVAVGPPGSILGRDLSRAQHNNNADSKKEGALIQAFQKITHFCDADSLPRTVQDAAKQAYRVSYGRPTLRSRSSGSMIAAAIFVACRYSRVPRTFKEIAALTQVPPQEIGRTFKFMERVLQRTSSQELGLSNGQDGGTTAYRSTQTRAEDLIRRFCSRLDTSMPATRAAEHIATRVRDLGTLAGRSPTSVAAAAIYMATALFDEPLPGATIAEYTDVSDGTIRTSYRLLHEVRQQLIDPEWIESGKANLARLPKV